MLWLGTPILKALVGATKGSTLKKNRTFKDESSFIKLKAVSPPSVLTRPPLYTYTPGTTSTYPKTLLFELQSAII